MIRRAVATVLALCLIASLAEAVIAQVRVARSHAPDSPTATVTLEEEAQVSVAPVENRDDDSRRLHHHSDDREHDPAGERCVHHHAVGPITALSYDVGMRPTAERDLPAPATLPTYRTRAPAPEPPRA